MQKFGFGEAEFPYFRTLHSLCYRMLGKLSVMQTKDWFQIAGQLGISFSAGNFDSDEFSYATKGDHMMNMWSLSRAKLCDMKDVYSVYPENHVCSYPELEHFREVISNFKEEVDRIDYTDILEMFLKERPDLPNVRALIVDEAQDLSNLQIQVINYIGSLAKDGVWLAGDDDQCVHEWNGANAQWFIELESELTVLGQSYRIPKLVHDKAEEISRRIATRIEKDYKPRDEEGKLEFIHPTELDMNEGSWMVLCRNRLFFDFFEELCLQNGWPYRGTNTEKYEGFIEAAKTHEKLAQEMVIPIIEARNFYSFLSRKWVGYGGKKRLDEADDDMLVNVRTLIRDFSLKDLRPVMDMLDRGSEKQLSYLSTLLNTGKLMEIPRIEISTIHNSKGRECDNVALCPDLSFKTWKGMADNLDAEHRVFYVGATRAKQRLVILQPLTDKFYDL
jgi:DNA helicase-2/ATP-dependent DNA helicase PcrA